MAEPAKEARFTTRWLLFLVLVFFGSAFIFFAQPPKQSTKKGSTGPKSRTQPPTKRRGPTTRPTKSLVKTKAKVVSASHGKGLLSSKTRPAPPRRRKITDLGTIVLRPKPAPRKSSQQLYTPAPKPRKAPEVKLDPAKVFYPLPFGLNLKKVEARYKRFFKMALANKIGNPEKYFLKQLYKERLTEAKARTVRAHMVRLAGIRYLRWYGLKKYRLMGYQQLYLLERSLAEYLALKGSPLKIPVDNQAQLKAAKKVMVLAGYYPMLMRQLGLKENSYSLTPSQRFWFRTLFLARWGRQAWGLYPLPAMLGNGVYMDYLKARVLWTKDFRKRLWAVRELRRLDPKFPLFRVLGWLFIQNRHWKPARSSFKDALRRNPKDQLSRSLLDKISPPPT